MEKTEKEVADEFNKWMNMGMDELAEWLRTPQSEQAGTGVGKESGHKILAILRKNPEKDPEKYDAEDLEHMRKVNGYIKRHLAQEDHLKETKTGEELENAKSTISLKNWGHDPTKGLDNGKAKASAKADDADDVADPTQDESDKAQSGQRGSEKNGKQEQADGKKRKLDEDEPGQTDAAEPESQANGANGEADGEGEGDGDVDEIDDEANGEEDRPRKKTKVDDDD